MRSTYDLEPDRGVDWLLRAACRDYDPEWWTAGSTTKQTALNERARRICRTCPVRAECLRQAERLGSVGVIVAGRARHFRREDTRGHGRKTGPRQCVRCEAPYTTADPRRVYCTERCRMDANNGRRVRRRAVA